MKFKTFTAFIVIRIVFIPYCHAMVLIFDSEFSNLKFRIFLIFISSQGYAKSANGFSNLVLVEIEICKNTAGPFKNSNRTEIYNLVQWKPPN